jgi:hypothetical protein
MATAKQCSGSWAVCVNGHVFRDRSFRLGPGASVTMTGCWGSPCPECGQRYQIIDGTYTGAQIGGAAAAIRQLADADIGVLARELRRTADAGPDQVAEAVKRAPVLRRLLRPFPRDQWLGWIQVLLQLISIICQP